MYEKDVRIHTVVMSHGADKVTYHGIFEAKNVNYEPRCEKTGLRGFRPGPTQTRLYNHTRWLDARNFVFRN